MRFFLRSSRRQLQQVQFSFRFLLLFAFCVSFAAGAAFGKMERTSAIAGWRLLFAPQVPLRVHIRIYEHTAIVYGHAIRRLLNYKRISLYEAYGTLLDATRRDVDLFSSSLLVARPALLRPCIQYEPTSALVLYTYIRGYARLIRNDRLNRPLGLKPAAFSTHSGVFSLALTCAYCPLPSDPCALRALEKSQKSGLNRHHLFVPSTNL